MPTESSRLQSQALRRAQTADRLTQRFTRQLTTIFRGLEREVIALSLPGTPPSATIRIQEAQAIRAQLADIVNRSGYAQLAQAAVGGPFDQMAIGGPDVALRLDAVRQVHLAELLDEGRRLTQALQRAAVRGFVGSTPRRQMLETLAGVVGRSEAQIATLYDTSLSIFGREAEVISADPSPRTRFVYLGPRDKLTRPFCRQWVGKVLERREIDKLDNGQLGTSILTGGGYNCRHQWTEISQASPLNALHGTGNRIPELGGVTVRPTPKPTPRPRPAPARRPPPGPTGPKVSRSLDIPRRGEWAPQLGEMASIDQVHGDGPLTTIKATANNRMHAYGQFSFSSSTHDPIDIQVNLLTAPGGTLMHEVGHWLDYNGLPKALNLPTSRFEATRQTDKHPALKAWRRAVDQSPEIKALKRWQKGLPDANGVAPQGSRQFRSYLLQRAEVFARSYAQYVAKKSGNARAMEGLQRVGSRYGPMQWSDKTFAPIEKAFDDLFEAAGWRRK